MSDYYNTILAPKREEIKVEKSKFIASVSPVLEPKEALAFVEQIRKEFHDARHHCYAYQFGVNGIDFRSSDDGEPKGTAGKPILFSIKKSEYSDIILVVTRYFGGVKLGTGGLSRAYAEAATAVLDKCLPKRIDITQPIKVFCTYEDINVIKRLVSEYAIKFEENYEDVIEIITDIPKSKVEEFREKVLTITNSRAGTKLLL